MKFLRILGFLASLTVAVCGAEQPVKLTPPEIARAQLGAIVLDINENKAKKMGDLLHPSVNIVLQNMQLFHSRAQWNDFLASPQIDGDFQVKSVRIKDLLVDDEYSQLDSDTFIVSGKARFIYEVNKNNRYPVPSRWLAVFHKEGNEWLLASFQSTINIVDNPIFDEMKNQFYFISLLTFVVGIILGLMYRRIRRWIYRT